MCSFHYVQDDEAGMNPDSNPDAAGGEKMHQESTQWFGFNVSGNRHAVGMTCCETLALRACALTSCCFSARLFFVCVVQDTRQCSFVYGVEAVKQFLKDNKLTSIIRAHEAQVDGYKMQMVNKSSGIPRVITIFSAPNYCDVYKNKAACLKFDNNVLNIKQFIDSPHPYYLPNFMDVFQWSLPFVAEKVTDMLANVLDFDVGDEGAPEDAAGVVAQRGGLLKKKVLSVSKILRMYKILRQEHEAIVQLKQLTPNHKMPFGLLGKGSDEIQRALSGFESAKQADLDNEKRPSPPPSPHAGLRNFIPAAYSAHMHPEGEADSPMTVNSPPAQISVQVSKAPSTSPPAAAAASSSSSSSSSAMKQ